jgi:DNA-binding IclR family transcriptional regulator
MPPEIHYAVPMEERTVQYNEQTNTHQETAPASVVPAPMVERAFRLLDLLSDSEEGLTLSDLARALSMSKGSVHGLLKTLESNGAIELAENRRYILGPYMYELAQAYIQRAGLRHFAVPAMHRLAASIGETVLLGRIEQNGVRIIKSVVKEGEYPALHIAAQRGTRVHLLAAATGPFVLASWPAAQREAFLYNHPLPHFTEYSITDPQQFLARIEEAVRTGVSIDHEEYLVGVNAIATAIYGAGGTLTALLWIVGFTSRFGDEAMRYAAEQLRSEAEGISRSLGATR